MARSARPWHHLSSLGDVIAADRRVLDLRETATIASTLDDLQPDLIVNPAAYTQVDAAEDGQEEVLAVNAVAPAALAAWASRHAVPIVHFSTDYVYGGSGSRPWPDAPTAPGSAYARSKLAGEEAIRVSGAPHLIIQSVGYMRPKGGTSS